MRPINAALLLPARKKDENENLIPLINIVFLLLIFFMVAGQMTWLGQLDVEPPSSSSAVSANKEHITVAQEAGGQLYLDGTKVTLETLALELKKRDVSGTTVNLSLDKHLVAKDLDAVLSILKEQSVIKVSLFTHAAK